MVRRRRPARAKSPRITAADTITFQIVNRAPFIHLESCWWCKGTGQVPSMAIKGSLIFRPCPRCDGTGTIPALTEPPLPGERL